MKVKIQCAVCKGAGVIPIELRDEELDGYAIQCYICRGTGYDTLEFTEFQGYKKQKGTKVVLAALPIWDVDKEELGGIPYESWLAGEGFPKGSEMRERTCPAWWFQYADRSKKPKWEECVPTLGREYGTCEHFKNKKACWERYDKENQ